MASTSTPSASIASTSVHSASVATPAATILSRTTKKSSKIETEAEQTQYMSVLRSYKVILFEEYELPIDLQVVIDEIRLQDQYYMEGISVLRRPLDHPTEEKSLFLAQPELYSLTSDQADVEVMHTLHITMYELADLRKGFSKEASFGQYARQIVKAICDSASLLSVKPTRIELEMSLDDITLKALNLPGLITSRPDYVLGLTPKTMKVRRGLFSPVWTEDSVLDYVALRSVDVHFCPNISHGGLVWFPWLSVEDKCGRGAIDKARLQCYTAMRSCIALIERLHLQALTADELNCQMIPPIMKRVYGLRCTSTLWELDVMISHAGQYITVTIWTGSCVNPRHLLEISSILRYINLEYSARSQAICNWLFCLRNEVTVPSIDPEPLSKVISDKDSVSSSTKSRSKKRKAAQATSSKPSEVSPSSTSGDGNVKHATIMSWLLEVNAESGFLL